MPSSEAKKAEIRRFRNGLPRQSADRLAMTDFSPRYNLPPVWEDFFAIFSENGGYFDGLKKMADVRHPVFPTLADFPYIQGGTVFTIILTNHGVPQGSAAAVQEGLTRNEEGRPENEGAACHCPKRQHGEKDAAV